MAVRLGAKVAVRHVVSRDPVHLARGPGVDGHQALQGPLRTQQALAQIVLLGCETFSSREW